MPNLRPYFIFQIGFLLHLPSLISQETACKQDAKLDFSVFLFLSVGSVLRTSNSFPI